MKPTHSVKPSTVLYQVPGIRIILGVFKRPRQRTKPGTSTYTCRMTSAEQVTGCPLPSTEALSCVLYTRRELATRHSSSGRAKTN